MTELEKAHARIEELEAQEVELCTLYGIAQAENGKLRAELEAIGAGGVNGPLMRTPTSGAADLPEALYADAVKFAKEKASISYVQRKCRCGYNKAERMLEQMVADCIIPTYNGRKDAALTAQAISQPGGFDAGDMASAAAQGYRDGWTAAQAISAESAGAMSEQEIVNQFDFLEGLVNEYTFRMIVDAAKNIQADALASHGQALAQPGQAGERDYRQGYEQRDAEVRGALV